MTRQTKTDSDGFLSRWSDRKAAARRGETPPEPGSPTRSPEKADVSTAEAETSRSDKPVAPPDLPPLESLDEKSDYSVFFAEGVSEALRRAALRKLFHTAAFNVTDGLDDYAEDFRTFKPLGDVITHEMKRMAALEEKREREKREAQQAEIDRPAAEPDEIEMAGREDEPLAEQPHSQATEEPTEDLDTADEGRNT